MPENQFILEVPIDASGVEDLEANETVSVAAIDAEGKLVSATAKIGRTGKTKVKLAFRKKPSRVQLFVGPGSVEPKDLPMHDSLELQLSARSFGRGATATVKPIVILPAIWIAWRFWCRKFKVSGRITCPDGRPVPGAKVTAFDVDWWWWWISKQSVGTTVTDQQGYYELEFLWCCAYRPWWWWSLRHWRLEPGLIDRIKPILELDPRLPDPPDPTPTPDPSVFERLIADLDRPTGPEPFRPIGTEPLRPTDLTHDAGRIGPNLGAGLASGGSFDPASLAGFREPLLERLPQVEELTRLRVWPWYPWFGWRDCAPDLIFRVTQDCGEDQDRILIDENFLSTRWNVGTDTVVNFVASEACCIDDTPQPEGDCMNLTSACGYPFSAIGGNPTAGVAAPVGYYSPGAGDHPFGGLIDIYGDFGTAAGADYYQLQWFDPLAPGGGAWKELPAGSMGGFNRRYFGPELPAGPIATHTAKFPVQVVDGRTVIETRQHFEAQNGAGSWENLAPGNRWWTSAKTKLARWFTDGFFADGVYRLRIVSWHQKPDGTLDNENVLGVCGSADLTVPHEMVLRIDNRIITDQAAHGDNCGLPNYVHICTDEPETRILQAEIVDAGGAHKADLAACSDVDVAPGDKLKVRFRARDADGHLARYALKVTYGDSEQKVIVAQAGDPAPVAGVALTQWGGGTIVGPGYSQAVAQSAPAIIRPIWHGGDFVVTAPANLVFPKTCCYQLELRAYKRTIVNCNGNVPHRNLSERSFMIRNT